MRRYLLMAALAGAGALACEQQEPPVSPEPPAGPMSTTNDAIGPPGGIMGGGYDTSACGTAGTSCNPDWGCASDDNECGAHSALPNTTCRDFKSPEDCSCCPTGDHCSRIRHCALVMAPDDLHCHEAPDMPCPSSHGCETNPLLERCLHAAKCDRDWNDFCRWLMNQGLPVAWCWHEATQSVTHRQNMCYQKFGDMPH